MKEEWVESMKLKMKDIFDEKSTRVDCELEELLDFFREGIYMDQEGNVKRMPYTLQQLKVSM